MFVELIDRLRCLNAHEETCLVATATRTVDRHILEGVLGCPACGAEYAIRDGVAWFGVPEPAAAEAGPARSPSRADDPIRLAAMLGLGEHGGLYVLGGAWAACAPGIAAQFPDSHLALLSAADSGGASLVLLGTGLAIPLASGSARGVALDRAPVALIAAAARVLAAKGRLVAPAPCAVPAEVTVLARDDAWWVGERASRPEPFAPVTPRRAAPRTGRR